MRHVDLEELLKSIQEAPERAARERHRQWMKDFEQRCTVARIEAVDAVHAMFAAAFPRRFYVFLIQRPRDSEPWPAVYSNRDLAEKCEYRATRVLEVLL